MTAQEQAQSIVEKYCPEGAPINRRSLTDAIRWAIIRSDIDKRQPKELTHAQAGTMAYQILFFVDEWTRTFEETEYPEQANALRLCRTSILAVARGEPRKPVQRETGIVQGKAKGARA
jgi:hypothetical protein